MPESVALKAAASAWRPDQSEGGLTLVRGWRALWDRLDRRAPDAEGLAEAEGDIDEYYEQALLAGLTYDLEKLR